MGSSSSSIGETIQIQIGNDTPENLTRVNRPHPHNRVKTAKYTVWTFFPLTLLGQFMRIANFYFLMITIITWTLKGFYGSTSTLLPLSIVIVIAMLKQAREDYMRHKADQSINHSIVTVVRNGSQVEIESQFIAPGDLVVIKKDTDVPCDLVILQTTDPNGKCYVTTANLDGETNLKSLFIPRGLPEMHIDHLNSLGVIECEVPKADLYHFQGKIELMDGSTALPLTADNLLLRGTNVKDTDCIIGCAIYLGMNTKMQLNSRMTSHKRATSEWYMNVYLMSLVVFMVLFVTLLYVLERYDQIHLIPRMDYIGPPKEVYTPSDFFEDYFFLLLLFNYMVPITVYATSEIYRAFGTLFMRWDLELYDEESDEPCVVRTSNLHEELGQIDVLFSDKTGTLTKNSMAFQRCSINGRKYIYTKTKLLDVERDAMIDIYEFNSEQRKFFEALAICHTVRVAAEGNILQSENNINFRLSSPVESPDPHLDVGDTLSGNVSAVREQQKVLMRAFSEDRQNGIAEIVQSLDYQAASADEKALIEGCAHLGLVYLGDEQEIIKMRVLPPHVGSSARPFSIGETKGVAFERLHILEFTPERKRMSVIVRDRMGIKWIYTKGAESSIFPICDSLSKELIRTTGDHINEFATKGLRTLAIARKQLSEEDYELFLSGLNEANSSLNDRQELTDRSYEIVERDLTLLGATAVEDILQDDVESTLSALQNAGIKIWVLTGDKVETALSIALSCGHIPKDAERHLILNCTEREELRECLNGVHRTLEKGLKTALLIDSKTLSTALNELSKEFRRVAIQCQAVLCCRLSPLQKSQVVDLIKNGPEHFITAAIGDGANDVSMIQEAQVGIGIMGKEGRQAVMSADYAIGRFSMVKRLLLVHGHYNTTRLARMICFYFYENILVTMCAFYFQFFAMYSGTMVYDRVLLLMYTTVFNSVSIVVLSILEKPYSEELLMSNPCLYNECRHYKPLGWKKFLLWVVDGLYQSVLIFFFAYAVFSTNDVLLNVGQTAGLSVFGLILIQCVTLVSNLKQFLETCYVTKCYVRSFAWAILTFVVSAVIRNAVNVVNDPCYWAYFNLLSSIPIWLFMIITIVSCLLPSYLLRYLREGFQFQERWSLLDRVRKSKNEGSYSFASWAT